MKRMVMVAIVLAGLVTNCFAEEVKDRRWYRDAWCTEHAGVTEFEMSDRMTADCVTETHAVRVDFGANWTQALGFALHYAMKTGKQGGVVLILDQSRDYMHWIRLNTVLQHYKLPIDAWFVDLNKIGGPPAAVEQSGQRPGPGAPPEPAKDAK